MRYLRIKNPGVAPIESFTTLGLSTSNDAKQGGVIGQFGTGNKHAINLLLRNDKKPVVYLGSKRVEFGSEPKTVHAPDGMHVYEQATIIVDGESSELGYTVDFGHHDWDEISMALREFISNALDMTTKLCGTHQDSQLDIRVVNKPEPVEGCTCVFVEADDECRKYVREIGKHFLHFSGRTMHYGAMEHEESNAQLYREGVLVREVDKKSLFDYNMQSDKIKIDECRNLDRWRARSIIKDVIEQFDKDQAVQVLQQLGGDHVLELDLLEESYSMEVKEFPAWQEAIKEVFTDKHVSCTNDRNLVQNLIMSGYLPVVIPSGLRRVFTKQGLKSHKDVLSIDKQKGHELVDGSPLDHDAECIVWDSLAELGVTNNKDQPEVKYFREAAADSMLYGYIADGLVFVNAELRESGNMLYATLVEQFARHIAGHENASRNMQSWLCSTLAKSFFPGEYDESQESQDIE